MGTVNLSCHSLCISLCLCLSVCLSVCLSSLSEEREADQMEILALLVSHIRLGIAGLRVL